MTLVPPATGDEPIWRAWMAAFQAPTLAIADELGLFPALAGGPRTTGELAIALAIEDRATDAIATLMTSLGFLTRSGDTIALTEAARAYLLPDSPYYWGALLRRIREHPLDCKRLIDALRRGRAAAEARLTGMWKAPAPPPEALVAFTHAMHAHSFALAMRTIQSFHLDGATRLLDVGGGSGGYSIAAAIRYPSLHVTELDLPAVCEVATDYARTYGVGDRFAVAPADMFGEPWPAGHDRILLANILHDWDDEQCRDLARRAYAALPPGGMVLVHEMPVAESKDGPLEAAAYSMIMVFNTQGRQRTASELVALLAEAGFVDARVTATANGYAVISGVRW